MDGGTWDQIRGLGILVHPSLPSWAYLLPTSFIGRIFPSLHSWGRRDLGLVQGSQSASWWLEGVRIWKLSWTYPGEKPPQFSLSTQKWCLATRNPTIPVEIRAIYEGPMARSVPSFSGFLINIVQIWIPLKIYVRNNPNRTRKEDFMRKRFNWSS